jgi:hypothetical protein
MAPPPMQREGLVPLGPLALLLLHQRRDPRMRRRADKPEDGAGNQARREAPGAHLEQQAERAAATCSR